MHAWISNSNSIVALFCKACMLCAHGPHRHPLQPAICSFPRLLQVPSRLLATQRIDRTGVMACKPHAAKAAKGLLCCPCDSISRL